MVDTWASLHGHSWHSLLDGISNPKKLARRAAALGMPALALTDHGNIGGAVDFVRATRSEGVRPILGVELYLCRDDPSIRNPSNGRPYAHLVVLAKNLRGWRQLIRAVSASNAKEYFYHHPRLSLESLREYTQGGDLLCLSGHPGSHLADALFLDHRAAYSCTNPDAIRALIDPDYQNKLVALAEQYISVFGRENFFLEIQILDPVRMPACAAVAKTLRWLGKKMGIRCTATCDSHYVERHDAYDQRTLLCSKLKTSHDIIRKRIANEEDVELGGFFMSDVFHLHSAEEMAVHHRPREIQMSLEIAAMCEDYEILAQPVLPDYPCPDGMDARTYLRKLCEQGFEGKVVRRESSLDRPISEYRDRLEMELGVIRNANLDPYFLIVNDCVQFGRSRGWLLGPGRGSAAGCLVSYLIGVTGLDPLPFSLLFERFYNEGRNAPGHISLPDVDLDFPVATRDQVFKMLQSKFGVDRVARIATFSTWQGRSAIDGVLSAHSVGFDERKELTKFIPDKARISEELQEMVERGEEPSILRYALEVYTDELSEWARLEDDGSISGEYGKYMEQAVRLEGVKAHPSIHAAGVIISTEPLSGLCPLKWDEASDSFVAMMDYPSLEALGLVKLDLLGVALLDKVQSVRSLALTGEIG